MSRIKTQNVQKQTTIILTTKSLYVICNVVIHIRYGVFFVMGSYRLIDKINVLNCGKILKNNLDCVIICI